MSLKGGYWREAATVILAGKCLPNKSVTNGDFDYKVLMLKRSQKSKSFAAMHVFPGGTMSDTDFDVGWDKLYRDITGRGLLPRSNRFTDSGNVPLMFKVPRPSNTLPAQIAFRLSAIRETFEECGILLITKEAPEQGSVPKLVDPETSHSLNLSQWRRRVNKDAGQFLELCRVLKAVPNIWSLYEWCNWLTPVMQKVDEPPERPRRFDTMFYVCCLSKTPEARVDNRETTVSKWQNPGELLTDYNQEKADMIGPQLYELSKLCNFNTLSSLHQYVHDREPLGIERWMPIIVVASDGLMAINPGDDLYPDDPDYNKQGPIYRDETLQELQGKCKNWNRMPRATGLNKRKMMINIQQPLGYVKPHPIVLKIIKSAMWENVLKCY